MNFYEKTVSEWVSNNENFFGVPAVNYFDEFEKIQIKCDEYVKKYWNSNNPVDWCRLRSAFEDKIEGFENKYFKIVYNFNCFNVLVSTDCIHEKNIVVIPIIYDNMNWEIKNSLYCPRAIAIRNNRYMNKIDNKVFYPNKYRYIIDTDEIEVFMPDKTVDDVFNTIDIDDMTLTYLQSFTDFKIGEDLETFKKHLRELPDTKYNYVINYIYTDYKYFFEKILEKVNVYNFNGKQMINCNYIIISNGRIKKDSNDIGSLLVLNNENNDHFAISNLRSVMLLTNGFSNNFLFEHCSPYFDAFKVSTNKNAGKLRLILDDIEIKNGMMYKTIDGVEYNQFEIYKMYYVEGKKSIITDTLSEISKSPYCYNDGPKRIMMTAKAYGQAISIDGEDDHNTHAINARALFSDFYGYTIGDGLVISESFAKKLLHTNKEVLNVTKRYINIIEKYFDLKENKSLGYLELDDYKTLRQKNINKFLRYENIRITSVNPIKGKYQITLFYDITLQVGDKLTNLHGAKGVVGLILPDREMPCLKEDFGNIKAGPFEIIISAYGINDRKNIGQIKEAYDRCGTKKSPKNLVEFKGETYDKAFGLLQILRLFHTNIYHASFSKMTSGFNEMINLGEMERNCLLIQNIPKLLEEIDMSSNRNFIEKTSNIIVGNIDDDTDSRDRGMFLNVLNSLGYELSIIEEDEVD